MMAKEKLDKQLKKGQQITVYAQGNIPEKILMKYRICRTDPASTLEFDMDCEDLEKYCNGMCLTLKPGTKN